jgi:hypothetical protein
MSKITAKSWFCVSVLFVKNVKSNTTESLRNTLHVPGSSPYYTFEI